MLFQEPFWYGIYNRQHEFPKGEIKSRVLRELAAATVVLIDRRILTEFPFLAESSSIMADGGSGSTRRTSSYALVDEDKAEQINQLKRSLSAYRGHLTRLYKEMELLFSNFGSQMEAFDRKCILDSLFTRYNSKAKDLLQLTTGSIEHERALQDHIREIEMKGFF